MVPYHSNRLFTNRLCLPRPTEKKQDKQTIGKVKKYKPTRNEFFFTFEFRLKPDLFEKIFMKSLIAPMALTKSEGCIRTGLITPDHGMRAYHEDLATRL